MRVRGSFISPPAQCPYLAKQQWSLHYKIVSSLDTSEFGLLLRGGWRRFGLAVFRPECPGCQSCQSIRVPVETFRPDRSQMRARAANASDVSVIIGPPTVSAAKLALHDKFHRFQIRAKDWPDNGSQSSDTYVDSFVNNPFPSEEWCYWIGDRLVGVGYVDPTPLGLSAIYFFYDPDERKRSLGTLNVMNVIAAARVRRLPHVYLGYYVEGCASLEYKARFRPNEVRDPDTGTWLKFKK